MTIIIVLLAFISSKCAIGLKKNIQDLYLMNN